MRGNHTDGVQLQTKEMIHKNLSDINHSIQFMGFDRFLLERFLPEEEKAALDRKELSGEEGKKLRECAYRRCYRLVKKDCPVSRVTLRSWFHVGAVGRPSRSQIFAFAFSLSLSSEELQEYLVLGLQEPGIQINDYQEMIFCFGLDKGISYEECQDMMEVFEREINRDTVLIQKTHTDQLWSMYEEEKYLSKEEFLLWMCRNAFYFKGYSKVSLNCFVQLKHEVLEHLRRTTKLLLDTELHKTKFFQWAADNDIREESYAEEIPRFLHNFSRRQKDGISDEEKETIQNYSWVVYASKDKNSDLLAELYSSAMTDENEDGTFRKRRLLSRGNFDLPESVYFMTDKYVSQLIGVAQQKEKEIRLSMARSSLIAEERTAACPEWVKHCMESYGVWKNTATVEQTLKVLNQVLRHQKYRCQQIKRSDLLPLIHYVAQKRYEFQHEEGEYVQQDAIDGFVALANETFQKCQMMELDERYQLDYFFLSTFGESEMSSLADVIEASKQ